jgi:N-ethylmaleimide reductase
LFLFYHSINSHGWANAPGLFNDTQCTAWKKIVDRVHRKNGVIFLQLWHMGRQSHSVYQPNNAQVVSASDVQITTGTTTLPDGSHVPYEKPRALTLEEVKQTVQDYKNCAALAKQAGFDGVEIHAANGYLIDQFLQACSNKRTDDYGGNFENRSRFLIEIVEAVSEVYKAGEIGVRIAPNGNFGGMGSEDNDVFFPALAAKLNKYNLAYLHVMDGLGFGFHNKCRALTTSDIRKVYSGTIMANCGLTRDVAEGMLRSGSMDLAAFGRLYISNPDLAERFQNNWPVAPEAEYMAWWQPTGAKGYTDYPFYKPASQTEEEEKKTVE